MTMQEQLDRIEAKLDALTDWSGQFDGEDRPIPKVELAERLREQERMDEEFERWEQERDEHPPPPTPWWRRLAGYFG
jgi:hypothetical protein